MKYVKPLLIILFLILSFTYGIAVGAYKWFPFYTIAHIKKELHNSKLKKNHERNLTLKLSTAKLSKADYDGYWVPVNQSLSEFEAKLITPNEEVLNNFEFHWSRIEDDNIEQVSGLNLQDDNIYYINRQDIQILSKFGLSAENLPSRAGIRAVIELQDQTLAYITYVDKDCAIAKIVSLDTNKILFDLGCVDAEDTNLDVVGGAHLILNKNEFLLAIGAGTGGNVDNAFHQNVQNDKSYWGKILKFTLLDDSLSASIFSKGHRNPQGMFASKNKFYAVEHGPRGGDEINEISEGNNYGWPIQSFGSEYDLNPINKSPENIPNYMNPLYTFMPSIGISDIKECPQNYATYYQPFDCLTVSSMRAGAIYFVVFNESSVLFTERIDFGSRIRKIDVSGNRIIGLTDFEGVIVGDIKPLSR